MTLDYELELAGNRSPYAVAALAILRESGCTIRAWRREATGVAHTRSREWEITVPRPTSPNRFFILAHEVAHQLLHRPDTRSRRLQRWEEEVEADEYAAEAFTRFGLPGRAEALAMQRPYLAWALYKSLRVTSRQPAPALADRLQLIEQRVRRGPLAPMLGPVIDLPIGAHLARWLDEELPRRELEEASR